MDTDPSMLPDEEIENLVERLEREFREVMAPGITLNMRHKGRGASLVRAINDAKRLIQPDPAGVKWLDGMKYEIGCKVFGLTAAVMGADHE